MSGLWEWVRHPLRAFRRYRARRRGEQIARLRARYQVFRTLLDDNHQAVELLTELGARLRSPAYWTRPLLADIDKLLDVTADLAEKLESLTGGASSGVSRRQAAIASRVREAAARLPRGGGPLPYCVALPDIGPDMLRSVGGKALTLARLKRVRAFRVPGGFVVPVAACRLFLESDDLYLRIAAMLRRAEHEGGGGVPGAEAAAAVRRMILEKELPGELASALAAAAEPFFGRGRSLAVRSSAVGEDSAAHSFAGQYESVLNVVDEDRLAAAFKTVVASAFSGRNLAYRRHAGLSPHDFDLAVLCLEMVDVRAAGILFTVDPNQPEGGTMVISAVHGLGELAVAGSEAADIYRPPRDDSGAGECLIARKSKKLVADGAGGLRYEAVPEEEARRPVLTPAQVRELARLGLRIEDHLGGYQDIEWAVDGSGEIVVLQARPLLTAAAAGPGGMPGVTAGRQAVVDGGQVASPGRGAGEVRKIGSTADLERLEAPPYVLVMHQSLVEAVGALRQAAALLVELGNPADHLSCVAREYGVPMLTGLAGVGARLANGDRVLVDTERRAVFMATENELSRHRKRWRRRMEAWKERAVRPADPAAARLHDLLVPLHLTDAYGPTFNILECRTIHDIVRYAHEKAVLAMFEAGDEAVENASGVIINLESDIPFHVSFIDLGGGLAKGKGLWIRPEEVLSRPFAALWRGIATKGLNWGPVRGADGAGAAMSRFLTDHRSARPIGLPNYALVTRDFLNLNARMDFHFTMVDAICGLDARLNYIKFRFKGGGTDLVRRCRRVRCLSEILAACGFFCDARDDLLTASIQGGPASVLDEKLAVIGRVLGFSRLLDAAMDTDDKIAAVAAAFMDGDYALRGE